MRRPLFAWCIVVSLPCTAAAQSLDSVQVDTARPTVLSARVVTATRSLQVLRDVPASVALLDQALVRSTPARSVADFMKVVPGFAMRDFQSALVSHPSRQAPVLRGMGGSSASRVLVLLDGVPINDPFAGWVHWSRVPMSFLSQAEVVRGGGSGVWGDRALSGVINLQTVEPGTNTFVASASGGSYGTHRASAAGSWNAGKFTMQLAGDLTKTDGFIVVPIAQRGAIDAPAGADDRVGYARLSFHFTPLVSAYVSGNALDERRPNATPLRVNTTDVKEARAGMNWITAGGSRITGTVFGFSQVHTHYFTTESADRKTEVPSLDQFDMPATSMGGLLSWSRQLQRHQLTVGGDHQQLDGEVNEDQSWVATRFTRRRKVNATQRMSGAFVQDAIDLGRVRLMASVRMDTRRLSDARRTESDLTNNHRVLLDSLFAPTTAKRASYNIGARVHASRHIALRGSVYTALRSPTMNELYKPFREAGNVIVEGNAALGAEGLFGVDGGVDLEFGRGAIRLTAFRNTLEDGIGELTVATAGATGRTIAPCGFVPAGGTCRQRRAIDEMRSTGVEAEAEFAPSNAWRLRAAWTYNPTEIIASRLAPALVGNDARGAAQHQYTVTGIYRNARLLDLAGTVRYVGRRFDDDLNVLRLSPFTVLDVRADRKLFQHTEAFVGLENLLDKEYAVTVANSGLRRNGMPRSIEGGLRYRW